MLAPSIVALVLGVMFTLLWLSTRLPGALLAGVAWVLYAAYEFLLYKRVLCSGECNIRVDLLLLWPLLLGVSLAVPIRLLIRRFRSSVKG